MSTRRLLLSLAACLLLAPLAAAQNAPRLGQAKPNPKSPDVIRVATYNLLNLFDNRDDPALSGDSEDIDDAKPEDQKKAAADAIRRLDADVLGLEEIESYDALSDFVHEYLDGMGYDYIVSIDVGQEQAVISRFPITEAMVWPHLPLGGVHPDLYGSKPNQYAGQPVMCRRSPLRVTVEVPANTHGAGAEPYQLTLFVIHHKSGKYNDYWRNRESVRFVNMIHELEQQDPDRNIILLGDFNAIISDWSVQNYRDSGMYDVFGNDRVPDAKQTTHESGRCIDFIFVNSALNREVKAESAFVLGVPVRSEADAARYWETSPPPGYASDHMPVAVDIYPQDR